MVFENTKKHLLTLKIVTCIIINILRLKDLHTRISSIKIINKLSLIKDISKITYNVITLNLISVLYTSVPLCMKIRKLFKRNKKEEKE
jgi:hypothetical protein